MRKCPECAEENIEESLFCKHCGRCLLVPDPEEVQRSTAMFTEDYETPQGIDFYDAEILMKSRAARVKIRQQIEPSVIVGWLILLNLLVFILMSGIVIK